MLPAGEVFHFGAFSLYPARRLLLENGEPIRVGARALDLLIALVDRSNEVVPREDLVRRVWPTTFVEESSLRVHIAALRKALGASSGCIANVPGKGYSFVGELRRQPAGPPAPAPVAARSTRHNLPIRLTRMIGRNATSAGISSALLTRRFVTITGEGGVGKTTLALAVAEENLDEYADGVAFVDLASCSSPALLASTIGRPVGLVLASESPPHMLVEALQDRRFLLVLDNCEHLVAHVAELVTELLQRLPVLRVLATSREAIRAPGEHVHRLETLPVPPQAAVMTAEDALRYESIQLLVERVHAANDGFTLSNADAPHAAELCRRLDGIPLAIELAAARVGFFGLYGLVSRLHDRLQILTNGHRTVMPRHQTLRALYDWSFDLMDAPSQLAFARLAVFSASFSLDAGLTMMPCGDRATALPMFLDLIAKSLVAIDVRDERRRYRLLDTARVYAMEKLVALDGLADASRGHAEFVLRMVESANTEWEHVARRSWVARHGPLSVEIRSALEWAQSRDDAVVLFAQIADASFLLFQELSQVELLRPYLHRALEGLERLNLPQGDLLRRLMLLVGVAVALCPPRPTSPGEWLAQVQPWLEQPAADAATFFAAAATHMAQGDYRQLLKAAERLELAAECMGDVESTISGRRFQAQAWHYLGHFTVAKRLAQEVVQHPRPGLRKGIPFDNVDRRVSMGIILSRTAWIEGDAAEARRVLHAVGQMIEQELEWAQCQFLAMAVIPIGIWSGDLATAEQALNTLRRLVERPSLGKYWGAWAQGYACAIAGTLPQGRIESAKVLDMLGTMLPAFSDERMLARAQGGVAGWSAAEVLRNEGERQRQGSPQAAERLFRRALELAREQGAVRWELRAAISLARLPQASTHAAPAVQDLLAPLARLAHEAKDPDVEQACAWVERLQRTAPRGERA